MWTGLSNLSASMPHNIVLNKSPHLQIHSWIFSSFSSLNRCSISENTGSPAQQYPHVKDQKHIQAVCTYDVKIVWRGLLSSSSSFFFFVQEFNKQLLDLLFGRSQRDVWSGELSQLGLADLQVTSHLSRQWREKKIEKISGKRSNGQKERCF